MATGMTKAVNEYVAYRNKRIGQQADPKRKIQSLRSVLLRMATAYDATNKSTRSITGVWVEEWLLTLKVASSTMSVYETYLKGFFTWAEKRERNIVKPGEWDWEKVGTGSGKRIRTFFQLPTSFFEEVIEKEENWYFRGMIATLVYTLGRGIELRERKIGDLRLDTLSIRWPRTKVKDFSDLLPVCEELEVELKRYLFKYKAAAGRELRDTDYLFPRYKNNMFGESVFPSEQRYHVHQSVQRIIGKHLDPKMFDENPDVLKHEGGHTIRRSMARNLYEEMVSAGQQDPIRIVQSMLGHSNRQMTEWYIGLDSHRQARDLALKGVPMFRRAVAPVVDIGKARDRDREYGTGS